MTTGTIVARDAKGASMTCWYQSSDYYPLPSTILAALAYTTMQVEPSQLNSTHHATIPTYSTEYHPLRS